MGVGGAKDKNYCLAFYDIYFYFNYTTVGSLCFSKCSLTTSVWLPSLSFVFLLSSSAIYKTWHRQAINFHSPNFGTISPHGWSATKNAATLLVLNKLHSPGVPQTPQSLKRSLEVTKPCKAHVVTQARKKPTTCKSRTPEMWTVTMVQSLSEGSPKKNGWTLPMLILFLWGQWI